MRSPSTRISPGDSTRPVSISSRRAACRTIGCAALCCVADCEWADSANAAPTKTEETQRALSRVAFFATIEIRRDISYLQNDIYGLSEAAYAARSIMSACVKFATTDCMGCAESPALAPD